MRAGEAVKMRNKAHVDQENAAAAVAAAKAMGDDDSGGEGRRSTRANACGGTTQGMRSSRVRTVKVAIRHADKVQAMTV